MDNIFRCKFNIFSYAFSRSKCDARRIPDFADAYAFYNGLSSFGSLITVIALIYLILASRNKSYFFSVSILFFICVLIYSLLTYLIGKFEKNEILNKLYNKFIFFYVTNYYDEIFELLGEDTIIEVYKKRDSL